MYYYFLFFKMTSSMEESIKKIVDKSNIYIDINKIINKLDLNPDYYLNLNLIKQELYLVIYKLIKNNSYGIKNRCLICNEDMGEDNPRQLCGKTKCLYEDYNITKCNLCNNIIENKDNLCKNFNCLKDRHYC